MQIVSVGAGSRFLAIAQQPSQTKIHWRDQVDAYLTASEASKGKRIYYARIVLAGITFRLDAGRDEYYAYGTPIHEQVSLFCGAQVVHVSGKRKSLENGLRTFMTDAAVKELRVTLAFGVEILIWKVPGTDQIGASTMSVPKNLVAVLDQDRQAARMRASHH